MVELNRRLVQGYERFKDDPRIIELKKEVVAYNGKLRAVGISDHQVQHAKKHPLRAFVLFWYRVLKLLVLTLFVLPGTLLFAPVFGACKLYSKKKAKEALAASNVKIQARDVMATWKLLVAMAVAPAVYVLYVCIGLYWYSASNCSGYLPSGIRKRYLVIAQFIFYPTVTYAALRFGEVAMDIFKSLGPLWKMMNPFSNSELAKLQSRREQLAIRVNDIINTLGPEMYEDFHAKRILQDPFVHVSDVTEDHQPKEVVPKTPPRKSATAIDPMSPTSPEHHIPRNESFGDLANQDIFSSNPHTPKKGRSRNASSANLGFQLKPFSTIDGNMDEVRRRLKDGVRDRTRKRRSSGVGSDSEEEGLSMGKRK